MYSEILESAAQSDPSETWLQACAQSGLFQENAYIAGKWVAGDSGKRFAVRNPATGRQLATVPDMSQQPEWITRVLDSAQAALPLWASQVADHRANLLRALYQSMHDHALDLARMVTLEQGKPLSESLAEVRYAADFVLWFAEQTRRDAGAILPSPHADKRFLCTLEPVGVCLAITPWNFPLAMITRKLAPALAAGCPVIIKPAEQTPLSALALAALADRINLPPGVVQVVTGEAAPLVAALMQSNVVRKISFTGSTAVGRLIAEQAGKRLKKVTLELGGNAPFIVCADMHADHDLDQAVTGVIQAKLRNAGQTCIAPNRIFVHRSLFKPFLERLCARLDAVRVGAGWEEGVQLGPLIHRMARQKVMRHVEDAVQKGGTLHKGSWEKTEADTGSFCFPVVLSAQYAPLLLTKEETFGPLWPVFPFEDEKELLNWAHADDVGLAAYVYTQDARRAWRLGEALQYGIVGLNTGLVSAAQAPFGGRKDSGWGIEGSIFGSEAYTVRKYWCWDIA